MAEIATAFVSLIPSFQGGRGAITKELVGAAGPAGAAAGKAAGKGVGEGVAGGGKAAGKGLKKTLTPAIKEVGKTAGAAFAGLAVIGFLKDANAEARESQKVSAQTAAVIKSTGGAAGVTAGQIGDLATAISNKVGIDDEAIQSGENMLLTFTNIRNETGKGNKVFDQATQVVTDMSVAMGTDMKSSAILVGKALNDPKKGLTALSRVGVTFTKEQKDQITQMVASGDTMGAQKVILKELTKEFGGSAAAQATAGDKAAVAWGNLKEAVGTALTNVLDKVLPVLTTVVKWISQNVHWLGPLAGGLLAGAAAWKVINAVMKASPWGLVIAAVVAVVTLIITNWTKVKTFLIAAWNTIKTIAATVWNAIKTALSAVWTAILTVAKAIWAGLVFYITAPWKLIAAVTTAIWAGITAGLSAAWHFLASLAATIWNGIAGFFVGLWGSISGAVTGAWNGISSFLSGVWSGIVGTATTIWNGITGFFSNLWSGIKDTAGTLWDNISSAIMGPITTVTDWIKSTWAHISDVLGHIWNGIVSIAGKVWNGVTSVIKGAVNIVITIINFFIKGINLLIKAYNAVVGIIPGLSGAKLGLIPEIPKLAKGGRVLAGRLYWVGENGPELFQAGASGFVTPNDISTKAAATAAQGGTAQAMTLNVDPGDLTTAMTQGGQDLITGLVDGITAATPAAATKLAALGRQIMIGLLDGITAGAAVVMAYLVAVHTRIVALFAPAGSWLVRSGRALMAGLRAGVAAGWSTVAAFLSTVHSLILRFFTGGSGWLVGAGKSIASGLHSGIQSEIGNQSVLKHIADTLVKGLKKVFGIKSPARATMPIGEALLAGVMEGIINADPKTMLSKVFGSLPKALQNLVDAGKIKLTDLPSSALSQLFPPGSIGGAGGDLQKWVATAVALTGVPSSWIKPLMSLAMHESGGNPSAINLWDSNALAGHPSQGLFQTIPSTFNAYKLFGTITDPVANAVAAIRYILATYGDITRIASYRPGGVFVGGYEQGTDFVPRTGMALVHRGEAIIPADQNRGYGMPSTLVVVDAGGQLITTMKVAARREFDRQLGAGASGIVYGRAG
jgi:transglycosylase-like protein with SLT domain